MYDFVLRNKKGIMLVVAIGVAAYATVYIRPHLFSWTPAPIAPGQIPVCPPHTAAACPKPTCPPPITLPPH